MIKLGCDESIPQGWRWVKAQDCIDVRDGTHDSPKSVSDGIPLVTSKNLVGGSIDFSTCSLISYEDHEAISRRSGVDDGDILYAMIGTIGNPVIVEKTQDFSIKNVALFKFPDKSVNNRFIYHFLNSPLATRQFESNSRGGTQKFVSLGNIRSLEIPLPPLTEQQRIAAILDKADAVRRKRQQAIQLADEFLRAVFLDMFGDPVTNPKGWDVCRFEDLTSLVTYGLTVRPKYHEEGVPLISAREIRTGELDFESCPRISKLDFDKLSEKGRPKKNDILFSKTGSIGHCAMVKTHLDFAVTQNAARIVPNKNVCDPTFLLAFMRTNYFYDLANKEAKGNAVKDLQLGIMKSFPMYIPPIFLQKKFADLYSKASVFSEKVSGGSNLLNSNFGALSQKAFTGNL
ncbi:restriction endonuclease subunit S [Teredinibacter turnerae]|uniref:restriction endonuclease subunit S n=1 Tax=Teredinibacter turnerae TaxID=2426 RepID=UPI00037FC0E7|nr:restriction endonuclease subunit S [Teredinibacter turnerae]